MDKKYNGFNNGRDTTDGVGGREVNHGTPETMTKEQTAVEFIVEMIDNMVLNGADLGEDLPPLLVHIKRAKEIEAKQLSAERERSGKLVEALRTISNHYPEWDHISGEYTSQIIAQQTLNEYDTATKES